MEDPYIEIFNSNSVLIDSSDHGTLTRDAALGFRPEESDVYYISARGSDISDTGTYTLSAFAPDEAGAGINTAKTIKINTSENVGIQSPNDFDWFHFNATEGEVYTLTAQTGNRLPGELSIAVAELFDSTKTVISAADGRYTDGSASLAFKAISDGDYYFAVRGNRGETGNYVIKLSTGNLVDDAGITPSLSRDLIVNTDTNGVIEVLGDKDVFNMSLKEGHTYRFNLSPEFNGIQSPLTDPLLRLLSYDIATDSYIELASNDNVYTKTGLNLSSEIIYTSEIDSNIYLEASASGDKYQGIYTCLLYTSPSPR